MIPVDNERLINLESRKMDKTRFLIVNDISTDNYSISISIEKKGKNKEFLPGAVCS